MIGIHTRSAVLFAALLLLGCAGTRIPLQTSPYQFSRFDSATEGLAIGSVMVVIADEDESALPLLLRHGPATSTAARAEYRFTVVPEDSGTSDTYFITVEPGREFGFVARMPAGDYRFDDITALGVWDSELEGPRFTVTAGDATYVGRFVLLMPARIGNRRASLLAVTDAAWAVPYPPAESRRLPAVARTALAEPGLTLATWGVGSAVQGDAAASGTCFAVSPDGLVLASAHVVDGARALRLRFEAGLETDARVVATNPAHDLAVLQAGAPTPDFVALGRSDKLAVGDRVLSLGYPAIGGPDREPTLAEGAISGLSGPGGDPGRIQASFPIQPGAAGTPLFFRTGEVVAIATATGATEPFLATAGALPLVFGLEADLARELYDAPPRPIRAVDRGGAIERVRAALCRVGVER